MGYPRTVCSPPGTSTRYGAAIRDLRPPCESCRALTLGERFDWLRDYVSKCGAIPTALPFPRERAAPEMELANQRGRVALQANRARVASNCCDRASRGLASAQQRPEASRRALSRQRSPLGARVRYNDYEPNTLREDPRRRRDWAYEKRAE